jgi:glycerol-1-phosphate dehydrogenase [NAD(P)+]
MQPDGLGAESDALHGEKVGVGTLIASSEYHKIKNNPSILSGEYIPASEEYIADMFGDKLKDSIIKENESDCASGITEKDIARHFEAIYAIISSVPTYDELIKIYKLLGAKDSLDSIGISEEKLPTLLEYSPLVRNRLTLMRLRRMSL